MLNKLSWCTVFLSILTLASCASTGRKIDQAAADSIQKGKTTRQDVVNMLGSPELITRNANGDTIFIYKYARATAKPATFIPFIGGFVGGMNVQQQMTRVTFGADDVVKDFSSTQGGTETSMGLTAGEAPDTPDIDSGKRPK